MEFRQRAWLGHGPRFTFEYGRSGSVKRPFLRAFTIVEVIVAASLFSLMLTVIYSLYALGARYLRMAESQSRLQQQAAIGMRKLSRELTLSIDDSLALQTGSTPSYVWFLSAEDALPGMRLCNYSAATGKLEYQKWVCFFHDVTNREIVRTEMKLTTSVTSPFLVAPTPVPLLANFMAVTGAARSTIARDVESFLVKPGGAGLFLVTITTAVPGINGQLNKNRLSTEIKVLNQQ